MRRHPVPHRLDRRLGVDRHDARLDEVGHVRPHHDDAEQLPVAGLMDRFHPADGLVLHDGPRVGDPRKHPGGDVVAILLTSFRFREPDARYLRIRVDRTGNRAVVDDGFMAACVLRRDLALSERGVRQLPVAGAVADRVDVRHGGAAVLVGRDSLALVELDADRLETETLDRRPSADANEHQVALDRLTVTEMDSQAVTGLLDLRALLFEMKRDPAPTELFRELLRGVRILLRNERREHLDDRHLAAEAAEDGRELAADYAAAQDDEPSRNLGLSQQALRVDASRRVETLDRRPEGERARRDDRRLEGDVLPALDRDRVRVLEGADPLHPLDAVCLEERRDTARHLLDDAGFPLVRLPELEREAVELHPELLERVLRLLQRKGGLHPRLRRDTADAQTRAAELRLALYARRPGAELRCTDGGGVTAGPSSENGDVDFHHGRS